MAKEKKEKTVSGRKGKHEMTEAGAKGKNDNRSHDKNPDKNSDKQKSKTEINFVMLLIFVVGIFAVIILGVKLINKQKVVSIDDLHEKNLKGKLDPSKGYMYNGFSFVYGNGLWFTKVRKIEQNQIYNIQLHYGPKQVQNISVDGNIIQFRNFNGTYIVFDPLGADLSHVALAASELSINMATFFNMMVVAACTKNETDICHNREIVNCENNDKNPIIYIQEAKDVKIIQDNNCIRVQGNGYELSRAVDRLLYTLMGIM